MLASFQTQGKTPVSSDLFTRFVKKGTKESMCCFTKQLGIGSRPQVALEALDTIFLISDSVVGVKEESALGSSKGKSFSLMLFAVSNNGELLISSLIFTILSKKKWLNLSARSLSLSHSGRVDFLASPSKSFVA